MASRAARQGRPSNPALSTRDHTLGDANLWSPCLFRSPSSTLLDVGLITIYSAILLAGSLYSTISPAMPSVRMSSEGQNDGPVPSYFARKSNIFNLYFVKIGWAWTTLAFVFFALFHPREGCMRSPFVTKPQVQAILRLAVLTVWWIAVSQWFFGPGLMDRSFRFTGGACEPVSPGTTRSPHSTSLESFTEAECKLAGGRWEGGHDISGHVFLLVMSSAALLQEYWPVWWLRISKGREGFPPTEQQSPGMETPRSEKWKLEESFLVGVVILDLWMLLMTAIYFHTFSEKVSASWYFRR